MEDHPELLYAAAGRSITAVDRFSGRIAWRLKLPRFFGGIITIHVIGNELYAGRGSYVYGLDRFTGNVLWERGLGASGTAVMLASASPSDHQSTVAAAHAAHQAAAMAGTSATSAAG